MLEIPRIYRKVVLVCTNLRPNGEECCAAKGSERVRDALKAKVKELRLPVRVSKCGCLGRCETGPTVVIMPDDLWFGGVTEGDVDTVVRLLKERLS